MGIAVYVEVGTRRTFAGAIEWPGWCRSGRTADIAIETLLAYGPRYAASIGDAGGVFKAPAGVRDLDVVEKLEGDATTNFGAPSIAPALDSRPTEPRDLHRLQSLLTASWNAFDAAVGAAATAELRKGPRGGGRELDAIRSHVLEADRAYLSRLGGRYRGVGATVTAQTANLREVFLDVLASRAGGEPAAPSRSTRPPWSPRYAVRRSAWHALDHAWEIEDRAITS